MTGRVDYSKVVLLSDLDGTLLDSRHNLPAKNTAALKAFLSAGGRFGLATGRTQNDIARHIDEIGINAPCILYDGATAFDPLRRLFLAKQPLRKTPVLQAFLQTCRVDSPPPYIEIFTPHQIYRLHDRFPAFYREAGKNATMLATLEQLVGMSWLKLVLCDTHERLEVCRARLDAFPEDCRVTRAYSHPMRLGVVAKGVSKGNMLQKLRRLPELRGKLFVVTGDYYNDIDMLKVADLGVAAGNAPEEVRRSANTVACSNDQGIIADILTRILPSYFEMRR